MTSECKVGFPAIAGLDTKREQQKSGNVSLKCHMQMKQLKKEGKSNLTDIKIICQIKRNVKNYET